MSYSKQGFRDGEPLAAAQLEKIEDEIIKIQGQLDDTVGSEQLKVTLPDDMSVGFASHNAGEIAMHVSGGGAVILYDPAKDRYLPLQDVSRDDYIARAFAYNAETKELESYEVYDDGTANYFVRTIVDEEDLNATVGDINTALDAIIKIQEELIGTITFTIYDYNQEYTFTVLDGTTWGEFMGSAHRFNCPDCEGSVPMGIGADHNEIVGVCADCGITWWIEDMGEAVFSDTPIRSTCYYLA